MRENTISIVINRLASDVYHFAMNPAQFSSWFAKAESQVTGPEGPVEIGSTFSVQDPNGDSDRRRFAYEVIDLEPGKRVAIRTAGRLLTYTAERSFTGKNGATIVGERIVMEDPPGLARFLGGFLMGRIKKMHEKNLQQLKLSLEEASV